MKKIFLSILIACFLFSYCQGSVILSEPPVIKDNPILLHYLKEIYEALKSHSINVGTNWDDLRIPGLQVKVNASAPDLIAFAPATTNLLTYGFDGSATAEQVYFTIQLPHSYKEGSSIYPHVHWTPTDTNSGDVIWSLEYSWANIDGTYSAPSTISSTALAAGGTAWVHKMSRFSAISGTGKTMSSMLVCRLYRNPSATGDTYEHDVAFLEIDFHYESDTLGSINENTK